MNTGKIYLFVLTVTFFLAIQFSGSAKNINAASTSYSDVSNAVASASPGDAVMIPAGTSTWTQQLVLKGGVSLIGAGTNSTIIVDELSRTPTGVPIISLAATNQFTEISQLQIAGGVTNTQYNYNGEIIVTGDAPATWRIDNVIFNGVYGKNVVSFGNPYAVVDHCLFKIRAVAISVFGDGYGDTNWATPPNYGGSNELYVENCVITNIVGYPAGAMDGYIGSRVVFRDNVVLNDFWANHGTESGQRYRSMRSFEIYNNTLTDTNQNFTWAMQVRGGTGVVFSNTATGYNNLCGMFYYRVGEAFVPWGGMTGNNSWDTNDGTLYLTGTHSGATGPTLTVSGANWPANQWVGYTVVDSNSGQFSIITANTANTISVMPSKDFGPMTFTNGDNFAVYRCEAGIDQPGRGSGDLLQGNGVPYGTMANMAIGGTNWPRQVSEPIYFWGNTLKGVTTGGESDYPNIQLGRDYINGSAKPGYTPYTYPHPLTFVTYAGGPTNTNTTGTNVVLYPPTGLHIVQ